MPFVRHRIAIDRFTADHGWVSEEKVLSVPEVQDAIRFGVQDFEAWKEGLPMPSRACRRPLRRFLGGVWHFAGWLRWKARL